MESNSMEDRLAHVMEEDAGINFPMNNGDRAIREILHLLESDPGHRGGGQTSSILRHAIICASVLCLLLFIAILVVHRKYSRSSSHSPSTHQQDVIRKETVIVITDDNNVDTEIICDTDTNDTVLSSSVV